MLTLPDGGFWAKVQDAEDPTNWVILSYTEGSKVREREGGREKLEAEIECSTYST